MKNLLLYVIIMTITLSSFAQGAGNWAFQSKTNSFSNTGGFFDEVLGLSDFEQTNAYNQQNYYYGTNDTVIYIEVKALINVKPDTYILILGLSQISDNLETCFELIDQRIQTYTTECKIKSDDIYVDFISQTPIFVREREKKIFSKKYVEVPKGFEIKKNIHIRYTDCKDADKYLKLAAKNEIYDIIRVDYIVNNHKAVYDSIRQECVRLISKQVGDYKKMGVDFEADYTSMEETNSCTYPIARYSSFTSYMPSNYDPLTNGNTEINLVNPNEKINIFYNKLPYNYYDIVINPDVVEPVVQFSQTVKIKFVLKKKQ
ncbi:MAG: hypothetical protein RBR97_03005 [Bacteroidales bacterium]|nr:hypothetical protein [Bacteroidales bacterium]